MKTLIFADVHLKVSSAEQQRLQDFVAFVRRIDPKEYDRVIILGDLFDFWFEYRHVIFSGYFDVLRALADLRDAGIDLHLICGNHDFWAGRFLEESLGITIHRDRYELTMGDKNVLFTHGDGINPADVGYRIFKKIMKNRLAIWAFGMIHPDWAMAIAQVASHSSRKLLTADDPSENAEVRAMSEFAKGILTREEVDVVFCGHTHHPVEEEFETKRGIGIYINTGDWLSHRTYIDWDGQLFERKHYQSEEA